MTTNTQPNEQPAGERAELPPLPEGKAVVRGPVSAFTDPESGTLVDFGCEGPLAYSPDDGEELYTADQMCDYARAALLEAEAQRPIDMVLYCPKCWMQHIDAPDKRTPNWTNPPHKSHLCHGCGHIWRPSDTPTNGVKATLSGKDADTTPAQRPALRPPLTITEIEQILARWNYELHGDRARFIVRETETAHGIKEQA